MYFLSLMLAISVKVKQYLFALHSPNNSTVSFDTPEFFAVNTEQYQNVIQKLKEQPVSTTTDLNTVKTNYRAEKDTSLFFTIPYDKGWSATLNGEPVTLKRAQNGFMKLDVKKEKEMLSSLLFLMD